MSTNEELREALARWRLDHRAADFAVLYNTLWPVVARQIDHYPEAVRDAIRGFAWGHFLDGLYKWNPGAPMKTWMASWMMRLGRNVHRLLHPGVPESRANLPKPRHP